MARFLKEGKCTPHMTSGDLGFLYMHFVSALPDAITLMSSKALKQRGV